MIKVLKNWSEVGEAIGYLYTIGKDKHTRAFHSTPVKNWDLAQIARLLIKKNRNISVLDMGCGGNNVLRLLYKQRFINSYGIDLHISFWDRWQQLMLLKNNKLNLPYYLEERNIINTRYPDAYFDIIICLSVIEHGVNIEKLLKEVARLLKKGGIVYLSTDYWESKVLTTDVQENYDGKWNILSKPELKQLLRIAIKNRLYPFNKIIPRVGKPIVNWSNKSFTFLSLQLVKG